MKKQPARKTVTLAQKFAKKPDNLSLQQLAKPLFFIVLLLTAFYAFANEGKTEMPTGSIASVTIDGAWSRATPMGSNVGAGFLTITNKGATADRLLGGTSSIGNLQIHQMKMNFGMMQMRQLRSLPIPAGGTVALKPGGFHVMFTNLKAPLVEGQDLKTTLKFEKAGAVDVTFHVQSAGSKAHASY